MGKVLLVDAAVLAVVVVSHDGGRFTVKSLLPVVFQPVVLVTLV